MQPVLPSWSAYRPGLQGKQSAWPTAAFWVPRGHFSQLWAPVLFTWLVVAGRGASQFHTPGTTRVGAATTRCDVLARRTCQTLGQAGRVCEVSSGTVVALEAVGAWGKCACGAPRSPIQQSHMLYASQPLHTACTQVERPAAHTEGTRVASQAAWAGAVGAG